MGGGSSLFGNFPKIFAFCLVMHPLTQLSEVSGLTNRKTGHIEQDSFAKECVLPPSPFPYP